VDPCDVTRPGTVPKVRLTVYGSSPIVCTYRDPPESTIGRSSMQAPIAVASAADRTGRSHSRPFVLSRPHGTVVAHGADDHFDSPTPAADALRAGRIS